MEETKKSNVKHVQIPDPTEYRDLKPIDRLVYANIKRYMDKDTFTCYPSMRTIAEKCGVSPMTVQASIRRLVKGNYIQILDEKHGQNNIYKFNPLKKDFERFTDAFLDNLEITPNEKTYLIGLQSQCYKTKDYGITSYSNKEIANHLNMSLDLGLIATIL